MQTNVGLTVKKALVLTWDLLNSGEKRKMVMLSIVMAATGMMQSLSLAALIPFVGMVLDPQAISTNRYLVKIHAFFGNPEPRTFLLAVSLGFLAVIVAQKVLLGFSTVFQNRLVASVEKRQMVNLLDLCLSAPYAWFIRQNTAVTLKEIMSDVSVSARSGLRNILMLSTASFSILCMVAFLVALSPGVGLGLIVVGGLVALGILQAIRPYIRSLAYGKQKAIDRAYTMLSGVLLGIKDVKISGRASYFVSQFSTQAGVMTSNTAKTANIQQFPGYIIEVLIAVAMVAVGIYVSFFGRERSEILTLAAVCAVGAIRLLPLFNQLSTNLTSIQGAIPSLEAVHRTSTELERLAERGSKTGTVTVPRDWEDLKFEGISYSYPGEDAKALDNIALRIERGVRLGVVGRSGAGKSTLVDVLTGLLEPISGHFRVGDVPLTNGNTHSWQRQIGYVPQNPFIMDESIRFNVALGMDGDRVDDERVVAALDAANLGSMLRNELPEGLETKLGDRGVRFSGGQRQRVAIARALYHDPGLVILDEATNALDTESEQAIMEALRSLNGHKTVIIVTHRLSTVRNCDRIVVLEDGKIVGNDTHENLMATCPLYQHFVELGDTAQDRQN